jgi:hypothetical protein
MCPTIARVMELHVYKILKVSYGKVFLLFHPRIPLNVPRNLELSVKDN